MAGRFVITLLAFAAPFILYALFRFFQALRQAQGRDPWPMLVLWLTGAVLAAETLALAALDPKGAARDAYESPFRREISAPVEEKKP